LNDGRLTLVDLTMLSELISSPIVIAALVLAICGTLTMMAAFVALARMRPLQFIMRTLFGLLLLAMGTLIGTIAVGVRGYQALTHERVAARVEVRPVGPQRFTASFRYSDGAAALYELSGDELYIDAHILKWKPIMNLLGLHTAYELDRVAGRYQRIEQERSAPRTVYALSADKPVDLFRLRQRYAFLAPLLDAEYGSATFVPANRPAEFELRVSTTGLLIREADSILK
jgi:hypothetical protein